MLVHIPTPLRSYTAEQPTVEAEGDTLGAVICDLERRFPGIRFRMIDELDRVRRHIRLFVNESPSDDLTQALGEADQVHIVCALSGG